MNSLSPCTCAKERLCEDHSEKALIKELLLAAAIIIPLLLLLLFGATSSYFDPVIYLVVIGASVLLTWAPISSWARSPI